MTTRIRRLSHRGGALALVAAVLLSACGGGDGGGGGAKTGAAGQATGSVEDQLGFTRRGIQAAQAKVENAIATCMRAEGFEYVPVDPGAAQAALTGRPNLSDEQFEAQFGYGISTLYDRASAQSDPNARIRQALSTAEQDAYDRALSGGNPEQTFFRATDSGDFTRLGGCTKQATDALFGGGELLTTLQRRLDELDESILADQRMVRAQETWRSCMRDAAGETYEDSEAIEEAVAERLAAIVGPPPPPGRVIPPNRSYDRGALAELQRLEVRLSDTDVACEKRHITPVETSVREAKETRFREVNAELLRRVKPLGS